MVTDGFTQQYFGLNFVDKHRECRHKQEGKLQQATSTRGLLRYIGALLIATHVETTEITQW